VSSSVSIPPKAEEKIRRTKAPASKGTKSEKERRRHEKPNPYGLDQKKQQKRTHICFGRGRRKRSVTARRNTAVVARTRN